MTEKQKVARLANDMLEIIDACDNGAPLEKIEEIMQQAISFQAFVKIVNRLQSLHLITIDAQHVAHRVRS